MHNSRRVHNGTSILWLKLFALYAACAGFPRADLYGELDPVYELCHVFRGWCVTRSRWRADRRGTPAASHARSWLGLQLLSAMHYEKRAACDLRPPTAVPWRGLPQSHVVLRRVGHSFTALHQPVGPARAMHDALMFAMRGFPQKACDARIFRSYPRFTFSWVLAQDGFRLSEVVVVGRG